MRISYWKIGIYVLTFLTYAYSGYGSTTIRTLRDSLIAAEAVFEDVFKNVIYLARKFKTVSEVFDAAAGSDEKCPFRCPTSEYSYTMAIAVHQVTHPRLQILTSRHCGTSTTPHRPMAVASLA